MEGRSGSRSQGCAGGRSAAARPDAEQEKRIKQLERALGRSHLQIEELKSEISKLNEVVRLLEGTKPTAKGVRRNISAAGRARISAAQKKRWVKVRAANK
jgi:wobble nucleotide-excising tRNase